MSAIREAYDLIKDKTRWTTGWEAEDALGQPIPAASTGAVRWCGIGAMVRVCKVDLPFLVGDLEGAACRLGWAGIVDANDNGGHAAILQVFEKVLAERGELA